MKVKQTILVGLSIALCASVAMAACDSGWYSVGTPPSTSNDACFNPSTSSNNIDGSFYGPGGNETFDGTKNTIVLDCANAIQLSANTNFGIATTVASFKLGGCGVDGSSNTEPTKNNALTVDSGGSFTGQVYFKDTDVNFQDTGASFIFADEGAFVVADGAALIDVGSLQFDNNGFIVCDSAVLNLPASYTITNTGQTYSLSVVNGGHMHMRNAIWDFNSPGGDVSVSIDSVSNMTIDTTTLGSGDRGFTSANGNEIDITVNGKLTTDGSTDSVILEDTNVAVVGQWDIAGAHTTENSQITIDTTGDMTFTAGTTFTEASGSTIVNSGAFNVEGFAVNVDTIGFTQTSTGILSLAGGSISTDGSATIDPSGGAISGYGTVNDVNGPAGLELYPSGGTLTLNRPSPVALGGSNRLDVYINIGNPTPGDKDIATHGQAVDLTGLVSSISGSANLYITVTDTWTNYNANDVVTFEDVVRLPGGSSFAANDIVVVGAGPQCGTTANALIDTATGYISVQCGNPCDDVASACPTECQQACTVDSNDLRISTCNIETGPSCSSAGDCFQSSGQSCVAGVCQGVTQCPGQFCIETNPGFSCVDCLDNGDCSTSPDLYCNPSGACVECLTEGDVADGDQACAALNAAFPQCVANTCVECRNNAGCGSSPLTNSVADVCDTNNNVCVDCFNSDPAGCGADTECTEWACVDSGGWQCVATNCQSFADGCEASVCSVSGCPGGDASDAPVNGCWVDGDCCNLGVNNACDNEGGASDPYTCVDCVVRASAPGDLTSYCSGSQQCKASTNECVECVDSTACPNGEQCDTATNTCVDCVDNDGCSGSTPRCDVGTQTCVECLGVDFADDEAACGCTDGSVGQNCGCIDQLCTQCDQDRAGGVKDCLESEYPGLAICALVTGECAVSADPCLNNPCPTNTTCHQYWCEPGIYPARTCHDIFADAGTVCEDDVADQDSDNLYCNGVSECDGSGTCLLDQSPNGPFTEANFCQQHPDGDGEITSYCSETCRKCMTDGCHPSLVQSTCDEFLRDSCINPGSADCLRQDRALGECPTATTFSAVCNYDSLKIAEGDPCRQCGDVATPTGICGDDDGSDDKSEEGYCSGIERCIGADPATRTCRHQNRGVDVTCNADDDVCTTQTQNELSLNNDRCSSTTTSDGTEKSVCEVCAGCDRECTLAGQADARIGCVNNVTHPDEACQVVDACALIEANGGCPDASTVGPCYAPQLPGECIDGVCVYTPIAEGFPCDDEKFCNGEETCDGAGNCAAGVPPCEECTEEDKCPGGLGAFVPLLGALGGAVVVGGAVLVVVRSRMQPTVVKTVVKKKKDAGASTLDKYKKKEKTEEKEPLTGGGKKKSTITINEDANKKSAAGRPGKPRKPSVGSDGARKASKSPAGRRPSTGSDSDKKNTPTAASSRPGRRPSKSPARPAARANKGDDGEGAAAAGGGAAATPGKRPGSASRPNAGGRRPSQGRAGSKAGGGGAAAALPGPAPKKVPPRKRTNSVSRSISFKEKGKR